QVKDFFRTPTAFLDATLVNLDLGFSLRVEGIGKFVHMDFASEGAVKPDWFQLDKLPAPPEDLARLIATTEEAEELKVLVTKGVAQGATSIVFKGTEIDISNPELVYDAIATRIRNLDGGTDEPPVEPEEKQRLS